MYDSSKNSQGVTPKERAKWGGWVFSAIFEQYVVLSRKRGILDTKLLWDGNRKPYTQAIEWCHFRWPWVTPDPGFKVTVVLEGEYLENGAFKRDKVTI